MGLLSDLPYLIVVGFIATSYMLVQNPDAVIEWYSAVGQAAFSVVQYFNVDVLLPDHVEVCRMIMLGFTRIFAYSMPLIEF